MEQFEGRMLGRARGAPRLTRSRSRSRSAARDRQGETQPLSLFYDQQRRPVCLICETPVQEHHGSTAEHKANWQSSQSMTTSGRQRYSEHAVERWRSQLREARGGMQESHQSKGYGETQEQCKPTSPDGDHEVSGSEPSDSEIAATLQASIQEEQVPSDSDVGGLWAVLCLSSTREFTIPCRHDARMKDISVAVAIATKCHSTEILLASEGRVPHGDTTLIILKPPYCFDIVKRSTLPGGERGAKPAKHSLPPNRQKISPANFPFGFFFLIWCCNVYQYVLFDLQGCRNRTSP